MLKDWKIEALTGYKPHTTFYTDFSLSDPYGIVAVTATYNKRFEESKASVVNMTELVLVLQWKVYEHYDENRTLAKFYQSMWEVTDRWCRENFKDNDLKYYRDKTEQ